jgi:hypothetical protein
MQVELTHVPNGRVAKLPITAGTVTLPPTGGDDIATKALMSKTESSAGLVGAKGVSMVSFATAPQHISYSNNPVSPGGSDPFASPNKEMQQTVGTPHSAGLRTAASTFTDIQSTASGFTGHTTRSGTVQTLLGPRMCLTVRLKGEIYPAEVVATLLEASSPGKVESRRTLDTYVLPTSYPYVPPMAPKKIASGLGIVTENVDDDASTSSRVGGLAGVPAEKRQPEVREIMSTVLNDLFRDIVSSYEMNQLVCAFY